MTDLANGNWSETDTGNTSAFPPNYTIPAWLNIAFAIMGALKRFWDRANPTVTTTGSSSPYVYTPVNTAYPTAYTQGEVYTWKAAFTSAGNDTLNVNGLGALPIYKPTSASGLVQIGAGNIQAGQMVVTAFDSTLNSPHGGFQMLSPIAN